VHLRPDASRSACIDSPTRTTFAAANPAAFYDGLAAESQLICAIDGTRWWFAKRLPCRGSSEWLCRQI
jgi:hypothetical protein